VYRAQAEADLVIVGEAPLIGGDPFGLGVPTRIGEVPLALGAVFRIPSIDPGDHHIDRPAGGTVDLLCAGHLSLLEPGRALGDKLILGDGISMMNHSRR